MKIRHLHLVPDTISHETVACLEELLERARAGKLAGLVYGAVLTRGQYIVNSAGVARGEPTLARGIVRALDDELGRQVWGEAS